jgi:hypothetical protein
MTTEKPLVYLDDGSPLVTKALTDGLSAAGVEVYLPGAANDPENPTSFIGGFRCAVLDLQKREGKDDAIDVADLLRVYQETLPVAFLHDEGASPKAVQRAATLGPTFRKPDEVPQVLAWVLANVKA